MKNKFVIVSSVFLVLVFIFLAWLVTGASASQITCQDGFHRHGNECVPNVTPTPIMPSSTNQGNDCQGNSCTPLPTISQGCENSNPGSNPHCDTPTAVPTTPVPTEITVTATDITPSATDETPVVMDTPPACESDCQTPEIIDTPEIAPIVTEIPDAPDFSNQCHEAYAHGWQRYIGKNCPNGPRSNAPRLPNGNLTNHDSEKQNGEDEDGGD